MNRGALAHAHARVRARRGRLLGPEDGLVLRGAQGPRARVQAFADLGLDLGRPDAILGAVRLRLGRRLARLARLYPPHAGVFQALLGLHEVHDLALGWRAVARRRPVVAWAAAFLPLGPGATVRREDFAEAASTAEVAERLRRTPWGPAVEEAERAHRGDPEAAQLAFERHAGARLVAAARGLPRREALARGLLLDLARARDLDLLRRAGAFGLSGAAAAAAMVLLPDELGPRRLAALAAWSPADGPLDARLPRHALAVRARGWEDLELAVARTRRLRCRRAFVRGGTGLAPAVALALLQDAEARSLVALAESGGGAEVEAVLEPVLSAGRLGG